MGRSESHFLWTDAFNMLLESFAQKSIIRSSQEQSLTGMSFLLEESPKIIKTRLRNTEERKPSTKEKPFSSSFELRPASEAAELGGKV